MAHPFHRRLVKEFKEIQKEKLPGIKLVTNNDNLTRFIFELTFKDKELYPESESYHLSFDITRDYPTDSPRVQFIVYDAIDLTDDLEFDSDITETVSKIPIHPHVYSNGHVCLNLLGEDWTPACSIESTLLSIQSMLMSNDLKQRPPDNDDYVAHAPKDPKLTSFYYHDDAV